MQSNGFYLPLPLIDTHTYVYIYIYIYIYIYVKAQVRATTTTTTTTTATSDIIDKRWGMCESVSGGKCGGKNMTRCNRHVCYPAVLLLPCFDDIPIPLKVMRKQT
ncbi:hypothetical protein, unlikely [Trypanosoma brucei gambiense DAL972]|uniref:Uncharacterized protein n=1 Tax=Trypanosoma brucei gambiense (strain MHOM/CI/86/DAL972) TaxID=679716 RepID=C9ZTS9_TRYB9|nr:hypothetical protein, unlikely [Trypanosoma brucei gambiense DAL972]CBH12815.1 hypothetical protein, unlikely [Trypanosoma brucei gambiense DAL972]|eukprot:XP_011775094.1 hypothetical protein, unlikely [Trypanosoma brucei gambiense DAL972]